MIIKTDSFIDYDDDVVPFKGPLKKSAQVLEIAEIPYELNDFQVRRYSFRESKISLNDSLFQILA